MVHRARLKICYATLNIWAMVFFQQTSGFGVPLGWTNDNGFAEQTELMNRTKLSVFHSCKIVSSQIFSDISEYSIPLYGDHAQYTSLVAACDVPKGSLPHLSLTKAEI